MENSGYQGLGAGEGKLLLTGDRGSVQDDEKVLETDGVDSCTMV